MSAHIVFIFVFLVSVLSTKGQNCPKTFLEFATCLYQRAEANGSQSSQHLLDSGVQSQISKCFTDNGCAAPDYDHEPCADLPQPIRSFVEKVRQEIGTASPAVEQCLKMKFARSTSECIAAVGLSHLMSNASSDQVRSTSQVYGSTNSFFFGAGNSSQSDLGTTIEKRESVIIQVNIATAVRVCREKNNNDDTKMKPVLQCLLNTATSEAQRSLCQVASSCDGNGATLDCKRQNRQALRVLCLCRREKQSNTLKKLDQLRQSESVPVLDVVTALGNGRKPEDTCNDIRSCYYENLEMPPPTLSLLEIFISMQQVKQSSDKPGSSQMRVDQKTLGVIRDLYDAGDFGDDECKVCDPM